MTTGKTSRESAFWTLLVMLAILCCHAGCASTSIHEMNAIQQNISMLHERVQALERRVEGVDGESQKKADLYSRLEELQVKVGALNGRVEEQNYKIEQLSRSAASQPPSSAPSSAAAAAVVSTPSVTTPPPPPAQAPPTAAKPPSEPQPSITIPEKVDQEKAQFDKASQAFQQGKFDTARKEYEGFLAKYPKSPLADGALYSIGECYFSEKRYQDAIEHYQQVIERYPKGSKVPQALLKQGTAFQQMGDATAARILYERLVEKYPNTPQAQAAQKKLKQLQ